MLEMVLELSVEAILTVASEDRAGTAGVKCCNLRDRVSRERDILRYEVPKMRVEMSQRLYDDRPAAKLSCFRGCLTR